jgi:hypothetical protein
MTYETKALNVPASVAAGTAQSNLDSHEHLSVIVRGTFSATISVEISHDGTNFAPIGSVTAPGVVNIPMAVRAIRCNTTAFTSGTPAASWASHKRS